MTVRRRVVAGTAVITAGQVAGQVMSFGRASILAHMLSIADVGVATALWAAPALLEMITGMSVDRLLVQASDGDDPRLQRTAQALQVVRMVGSALLLLVAAPLIASWFKAPEAVNAFRLTALVPLARGFMHMDQFRIQRELRFGPSVAVEFSSQLAGIVGVAPLVWHFGNYWAAAWLFVGQAVVAALMSHLLSQRRYGWGWDQEMLRRIFVFGWPLLVNGLLMYFILEGDQVIVGHWYGKEALALYGQAFLLAMAPTGVLARGALSLLLPLLSQARGDETAFRERYKLSAELLTLSAVAVAAPLIVVGGHVLALVFGPKYEAAGPVLAILAAMQAIRILRIAPTLGAMARGDTVNSMVSNIVRTVALAGVLACAVMGVDTVWIAVCGLGGEVLAMLVSVQRLKMKHGIPAGPCLRPAAVFVVAMALAGAGRQFADGSIKVEIGVAAVVVVAGVGVMLLLFDGLAKEASVLFKAGQRWMLGR